MDPILKIAKELLQIKKIKIKKGYAIHFYIPKGRLISGGQMKDFFFYILDSPYQGVRIVHTLLTTPYTMCTTSTVNLTIG